MIVLALDPGHTTGWAVLNETEVVATGLFPDYTGLLDLLGKYAPEVVIIEDFVLFPWQSRSMAWSQLETVQHIGVLKYLLEEQSIPYELQKSVLVKQLSKKLIGKYSSQHERDAVTHGIVFLQRQGLAEKSLSRLLWRRE